MNKVVGIEVLHTSLRVGSSEEWMLSVWLSLLPPTGVKRTREHQHQRLIEAFI